MMMDEARLAFYEQSEANAVFRPKRGDEHELRGEGRRKIKQEKNMYKEKHKTAMPAGSRTKFICTCKQLLDHCTTGCHSVFSEVNLLHENHFQVSLQLD